MMPVVSCLFVTKIVIIPLKYEREGRHPAASAVRDRGAVRIHLRPPIRDRR